MIFLCIKYVDISLDGFMQHFECLTFAVKIMCQEVYILILSNIFSPDFQNK